MKVLVCGGRDYNNSKRINEILSKLHREYIFTFLVSGGQSGADVRATIWANKNGIDRAVFPANWERGKAGGHHRNKLMLQFIQPDLVIAFPGDVGTENMCKQAFEFGVKVIRIPHEKEPGVYRS